MEPKNSQEGTRQPRHYDMTEESSKRPGEDATTAARMAENDDENEENSHGPVDSPNDEWAENKVATSLDDE